MLLLCFCIGNRNHNNTDDTVDEDEKDEKDEKESKNDRWCVDDGQRANHHTKDRNGRKILRRVGARSQTGCGFVLTHNALRS